MRSSSRRFAGTGVLMGLIVLTLGASCSVLGVDEYDEELDRLNAARAAWASQGIDSYSIVVQRLCFCGGGTVPARVVVRNGARISVTVVETGEPVDPQFAQYYLTVAELFDFVEDAIDRKAFSIVVDYHRELGVPLSIAIDYIENAADEEMAFEISDFQSLR